MASLTLKNLPDRLLQELRETAEHERRSLTQQIIHLLETALRERPAEVERRRPDVEAQVAAWRELAGHWRSDVDAATEAQRIVKARTRGRNVDL